MELVVQLFIFNTPLLILHWNRNTLSAAVCVWERIQIPVQKLRDLMDLPVSVYQVPLLYKDKVHAEITEIVVSHMLLDRGRYEEKKETGKTRSLLVWAVIYRIVRICSGKHTGQAVDHMM